MNESQKNISDRYSRTALLIGEEGVRKLSSSKVAVFGIGGVGSYAAEALVRAGIGSIELIDDDRICESNINRQLFAACQTIGMLKTEAAAERLLSINPDLKIKTRNTFFLPETAGEFDFADYDYVLDAIDTVSGKIELAVRCQESKTPIISAMGAGNKLDPSAFRLTDIYKTKVCPLARVMRRELKARGVERLKVVYSEEIPASRPNNLEIPQSSSRRSIPGSISFVPSVVGLIMAGEAVKELVNSE